ncbi:MAG: 50S ribosomal protein L25/general stress protein Ctc [Asticcacaulis sp.]
MADIVLDVEVRERTGTGGARETRNAGKVPGVLYGGDKGPVPIAVKLNEFKKALYTGRLNGHLVTLKHGNETQKVIAKAIDFHPVTDVPLHFDLYRVDENQTIKINVAVHFKNNEASPGLKKGGALNIALHEVEIQVPAGHIPEDIVVDLTGFEIGQSVHISDLKLPSDASATQAGDVVVASITGVASEEAAEGDAEA